MSLFISQYLRVPEPCSADQIKKDVAQGKDVLSPVMDLSSCTFGVRGHQQSVTCVAVTPDCQYLYTGSKEGHIFKWRLRDGQLIRILGKRARISDSYRATVQRKAAAMTAKSEGGASKRSGAARRRAMFAKKERTLHDLASPAKDMDKDKDKDEDLTSMLWPPLQEGEGHTDQLLALAISPDGKYLVSGGKDRRIGVWKIPATDIDASPLGRTEEWVKSLGGHKDTITALRFRHSLRSPYELFSASFDRSVKLWAVDQGSYVETLFGHQDPVLDLDLLREETAVSAGGRDRTARFWKVRQESQLVFRAGGLGKGARTHKKTGLEADEFLMATEENKDKEQTRQGAADDLQSLARSSAAEQAASAPVEARDFFEGSLDCIAMVDGSHFLSGGDSGTIALWSTGKKKPVFTFPLAHGYDSVMSQDSSGSSESKRLVYQARWITALATLPFGDLFVSGSWDGRVRLWQLDRQLKDFRALYSIDAPGFVNALRLFTPPQPNRDDTDSPTSTLLSGKIVPSQWARTGLGDKNVLRPVVPGHETQAATTTSEQAPLDDRSQLRTDRERQAPLLIIGLGKEPRLGRWAKLDTTQSPGLPSKQVRNGTLIVVLPLRH